MSGGIGTKFVVLAFAAGGLACISAGAQAQSVRYIASFGDNATNCTLAAPCRTLQRGINRTPIGGVLQIIDTGDYGSATIGKSITISAVGVSATAETIIVNAADAVVALRGLLVKGTIVPADTPGISIITAAAVNIEGCTVERFSGVGGHGIVITAAAARVSISDTTVRNNGGTGIVAQGALATVKSTTVANNNHGFIASFSGQLTLESVVATGNNNGVFTFDAGIARISNSVVTNNTTGLNNISGTLLSRGNNMVDGNSSAATSGTITALGGI